MEEEMRGVLAAVALSLLALPAHGGDCHAFRRHVYGHNYHAQKLLVVTPLYQAGVGLREEAVAEQAAKQALKEALPELRKELQALRAEFFKFRGEGTFTFGGDGAAGGQADSGSPNANYPDGAGELIVRKCASCHSGETPKGNLDLTRNVTDRRIASEIFLRAFSDDAAIRMPPDGSLTDDERQILFKLSESLTKQLSTKSN